MGRKAWVSGHDLADSDRTGEWFDTLSAQIGGIDILVNSASEYCEDRYDELDARKLSRSMAIHFLSPLVMMRSMYRSGREGSVVNILDTRAVDRDPLHASYHLGKNALHTATLELAAEMAPTLRINGVAPGLILPPEGQDENWLERLKKTNPMDSYGDPDDVAEAVLYLCTAEFVTGQTIFVDGGRHLKGLGHEAGGNG